MILGITDVVESWEEEVERRKSKREISDECCKALEPLNPVKIVHLYLTFISKRKLHIAVTGHHGLGLSIGQRVFKSCSLLCLQFNKRVPVHPLQFIFISLRLHLGNFASQEPIQAPLASSSHSCPLVMLC